MTAREIYQAVYDHFDGKVPTHRGEVNLAAIVVALLEVLSDRGVVQVEVQGLIDELMTELGE